MINAGNVKNGTGLPDRHGRALRSQSREAAGPVVGGLKDPGRTRAVGPGAYERYALLGLFGHGGVVGVSRATGLREACAAVNHFLKSRFQQGTWTSIAVLFNSRMGLHRDIQNMPGHSNHALALRDYTAERVWIEDDEGHSAAWLDDKSTRELRGPVAGHA